MEQNRGELTKERDANEKALGEKQTALRLLVEEIGNIHAAIKTLHDETLKARDDTTAAIAERRATFDKVVTTNDSLLSAVVERLRLEKLGRELNAQLSGLMRLSPQQPAPPPTH